MTRMCEGGFDEINLPADAGAECLKGFAYRVRIVFGAYMRLQKKLSIDLTMQRLSGSINLTSLDKQASASSASISDNLCA